MAIAVEVASQTNSPRLLWSPPSSTAQRSRSAGRLTVLHVATISKPIRSELGYGPIETVIYNIDRGLHELGHRSIVACSADSRVTGEQLATVPQSLGDYGQGSRPQAQATIDAHLAIALARAQAGDIDIVHMHEWFERVHDGSFRPPVPVVMTLHVPGPNSEIVNVRRRSVEPLPPAGVHLVAISEHQRREYVDMVSVERTIPHGIDVDDYCFKQESNQGSYLFSIGRMTDVKGPDVAIEVAKRSGATLILAGCVQDKEADRAFFARLKPSFDLTVDLGRQPVGEDYYEKVMKPLLSSGKRCIYVGELETAAKKQWYRHAQATLFPIRWGEPFGMVLVESMASGTPIVAFGEGAVPEIVRDGVTGFVVDSIDAMVASIGRIEQIDRRACRNHIKTRFSIQTMAAGYTALYRQLLVERSRLQVSRALELAPEAPMPLRVR